MRVQFNPRTYVVEPAYRDDNQGLWDFPAAATAAGETLYEFVRFEHSESEPADRERETGSDGPANVARLCRRRPKSASRWRAIRNGII